MGTPTDSRTARPTERVAVCAKESDGSRACAAATEARETGPKARMASPGWRPAAAAGEPDSTVRTVKMGRGGELSSGSCCDVDDDVDVDVDDDDDLGDDENDDDVVVEEVATVRSACFFSMDSEELILLLSRLLAVLVLVLAPVLRVGIVWPLASASFATACMLNINFSISKHKFL